MSEPVSAEDYHEDLAYAAEQAHRTAIDLVLEHLAGYGTLVDSGMPADGILTVLRSNLAAMRFWTPEHAAEVLAEAMTNRARR